MAKQPFVFSLTASGGSASETKPAPSYGNCYGKLIGILVDVNSSTATATTATVTVSCGGITYLNGVTATTATYYPVMAQAKTNDGTTSITNQGIQYPIAGRITVAAASVSAATGTLNVKVFYEE